MKSPGFADVNHDRVTSDPPPEENREKEDLDE
jgi:hypothetical protein